MPQQQWEENSSFGQQNFKINLTFLKQTIRPKFIDKLDKIDRENCCFSPTESKTILNEKSLKQKENNVQIMGKSMTQGMNKSITKSMTKSIETLERKLNDNSLKICKIKLDQQIPILDIFYELFDSKMKSSIKQKTVCQAKFLQIIANKRSNLYIQRYNPLFIMNYEGEAMLLVSDGRRIEGLWKYDKFQGCVKVFYRSKIIYYGQIDQKYKKHGQGNLYFPEGLKFVGKFIHGRIQGKGKLFDKAQTIIQQGVWRNGQVLRCINA